MDPSIFESDEFKQAVRREVEAILQKFVQPQIDELNANKEDKLTEEDRAELIEDFLKYPWDSV